MTHQTSTTPERTGHTASCSCGWGPAWALAKHNAERLAAEHKRKHKDTR